MPSRHRPAEASRVMSRPANLTWPASGDRSPEIRPNRLVLPAPFGPTIPTVSPALTENDRSSAMTTRPNRFVTWSSSSNGLSSAHLKVGVWLALRAGLSILVSHVLEISFAGARRVARDHVRDDAIRNGTRPLVSYVRSANACANQDCQQVSQTLRAPAGEVNARYVTVSRDSPQL